MNPTRHLIAAVLLGSMLLTGCDAFVDADERVARAKEHVAAQEYQAAAIELRNALRSQPAHVPAHLLLARVLLQLGDPAGAEKEVRRAIEGGASVADVALLAADTRIELHQFAELLAQIDAGELPLTDPQSSLYRGLALMGLNQADAAVDAFSAALRLDDGLARARVALAEAYALQGRVPEALRALDAIHASDPSYAQALLVRGTLHARRGEYEDAERVLVSARDQVMARLTLREQVTVLAVLAETQLARGDVDGARVTNDMLGKLAHNAPVSRLLAGRIAMAQQDYATAVKVLQSAVIAAPDFLAARFLLGSALLAQGNLHQAESHLSQVLQKAPENLEARKLLAQARLRLERPDAAMQVLLPAEQSGESDPQFSALMGIARLQLGDDENAISAMKQSAARQPGDRGLQLSLAAAYLQTGAAQQALDLLISIKPSQDDVRRETLMISALMATKGRAAARAQLDQWLAVERGNAALLNLAGLFHAQQGEFDRARALLGKALALKAGDTATQLNFARVEIAAGNVAAATRRLEEVLAADPGNGPAQLGLAELAARGGDLSGAQRLLEEFRKRDPKAIEPRLLLARLHMRQQQRVEADGVLREAMAAAPGVPAVANAIGQLYLDAGRYDEALARFREATAADPRNVRYRFNVARAQLALDQTLAARATLEEALKQRPELTEAVGALAMLDLREGKRDAAAARIEQLKANSPNDAAAHGLDGDFNMALGRYVEAADAFGRAQRLRPTAMVAVKIHRARKLGKLRDATAPLEAWLSQHPEDVAVRWTLAEDSREAGRTAHAIEQFELLLSNGAASVPTLNNLAWLYHETSDPRAEETAQRAYQRAPHVAAVADTYGWILVEKGRVAEGAKILGQALAAAGSDPDIGYHYAAALARLGEHDAARQRLTALLAGPAAFSSRDDARRLLNDLSGK